MKLYGEPLTSAPSRKQEIGPNFITYRLSGFQYLTFHGRQADVDRSMAPSVSFCPAFRSLTSSAAINLSPGALL